MIPKRTLIAAAAALALVCALAPAGAARAAGFALDRAPEQGGMAIGRTGPGCTLFLDGLEVRVAADGHFILGFGRDNAAWAVVRVMCPDGTQRRQFLPVAERAWDEERISGLPPETVDPGPEALARIRADAARVRAARAAASDLEGWREALEWPVAGPVTGRFGARRILDGQPRRPHFGVDIAAPAGAPVRAAAAGRVTLAETLFLSGGTAIIDHGMGLSSSYLHLGEIAVAPGDTVARGDVLGAVGATGRATGPHLDWRLNWYETRLDPARAAGPMPETTPGTTPDASPGRPAASGDAATATVPGAREPIPPESR